MTETEVKELMTKTDERDVDCCKTTTCKMNVKVYFADHRLGTLQYTNISGWSMEPHKLTIYRDKKDSIGCIVASFYAKDVIGIERVEDDRDSSS